MGLTQSDEPLFTGRNELKSRFESDNTHRALQSTTITRIRQLFSGGNGLQPRTVLVALIAIDMDNIIARGSQLQTQLATNIEDAPGIVRELYGLGRAMEQVRLRSCMI